MTPAENEFIERQFEHLFQTDDCTLCAVPGFLDRTPS